MSVSMSMQTLYVCLLGDFNADELMDSSHVLGPILFILFILIAYFVVLSMILAIISDAYDAEG